MARVNGPDVVTKRDWQQLREEFELLRVSNQKEHEVLEHKLVATFRAELLHQTRTMMFALSTAVLTVGGLAFAAARLA